MTLPSHYSDFMRQPWDEVGRSPPFSLGLGVPLGLGLEAPFCLGLGVPLGWGWRRKRSDMDGFGNGLGCDPEGERGDITLLAQNFFHRCKCLI